MAFGTSTAARLRTLSSSAAMPSGRCRQQLRENGGAALQVLTVNGVRPPTDVLPDACQRLADCVESAVTGRLVREGALWG